MIRQVVVGGCRSRWVPVERDTEGAEVVLLVRVDSGSHVERFLIGTGTVAVEIVAVFN